ncbi:Ltp family lipoprotein [Nocardioides lianchengensis]|uniref:Host cell surface-exposed lipoprotein n=1 Tax=Nocardioides lianchengensis TaxID=1045774 RepID=A0A1G6YIG0_9ACTN|nr:Ltp family lipoprotein [Nocardioides lianchengensis]NYG09633.1 putative small lipoprotein YifL [Nocardioides lianchengensis]SDD90092.1 Host cell surface-exposed lipoprotein [Nocardioides lianchengensis]
MRTTFGALALATTLSLGVTACEIPEDDSATAADSAEVNTKAEKPAKEKKKSDKPKETKGQENARRAAESYLDLSAFSRSGLIKQLKFEGYSAADAKYGVDAQKANWKKQAAASGENYLSMSSFSRSGLIDQLVFEGFSQKQAEYGADQNGL